jgi:hypothetical protein
MGAAVVMKVAAFILSCGTAFAGLRMVAAIARASERVRPDRLPAWLLNRSLPNADDRDTHFDYVDQAGWRDVSAAKMWGSLAALCLIGTLLLFLVGP